MRYGKRQVGYRTILHVGVGESDRTGLSQHPDCITSWRDQDETSFNSSLAHEEHGRTQQAYSM